jgi:outer membrane protein
MAKQRVWMTAVFVAVVGLAAPAVAEQLRLGYVDLQRALNETQEGQAAKRRLKRMFTKRQTDLDKMQDRIKRMEEDLKKQKEVLSEDAFATRVEAYRKAFIELQSTYVQYQRDLTERETQETGRILKQMQAILAEIGERDGYTAVTDVTEGGVFYFRQSLDLTNELIRLYDQRHPGGGGGGGEGEEEGGGAGGKAGKAGKAPAKAGKTGKAGGKAPAGGGKAPGWFQREKVRPVR